LEFVQAPVPYLIGISHQVIPATDFNAMLHEQYQHDLQVADLIVNLDTGKFNDFNEENKPNDEEEEFVEVNLTSSATLNPNSSNSRFRIGRHKSSKNIKWKGVKTSIISLPTNVATRLKQRYLPPSHTIHNHNLTFLNIRFCHLIQFLLYIFLL
jgi:hypothetical protein